MKDKSIISSSSLSDLIEKFSQENIIAVMEKEYASAPAKLIPTSSIADTAVISSVPIKESTLDFFADTLQEKGFYNPLVVHSHGEGYELILGRKRFLAAKKIGIVSLPCVVVEVEEEEELLMLLADNRDMKDCSVVQIALVYQALAKKFGYTQQTLASLSHLSRPQVTNILRILKLPQPILDEISLGTLSYGHGKVLAGLEEKQIESVVRKIHEEKLSVAETERYVNSLNCDQKRRKTRISFPNFGITAVKESRRSLSFSFSSEEEKNAFLELLRK